MRPLLKNQLWPSLSMLPFFSGTHIEPFHHHQRWPSLSTLPARAPPSPRARAGPGRAAGRAAAGRRPGGRRAAAGRPVGDVYTIYAVYIAYM